MRCCLIGSFLEAVRKEVEEAKKVTPFPFVHIRYVLSLQPLDKPHIFSGALSISSLLKGAIVFW